MTTPLLILYFDCLSIYFTSEKGAPMARITIEDCLDKVSNRFELVHLASKRVKQLREGADQLVKSKNKDVVTALREIAAGKIKLAEKDEYDSDEF